jgi:hypothetical protein
MKFTIIMLAAWALKNFTGKNLGRTLRCIFCSATGFSVCSRWGLDLHLFGWSPCRCRHFCVWQSCLRREAGSTWIIEHVRRLGFCRQLLNVFCACRGRCVHDWNLESVLHWHEDLCVLHIYSWLWCGAYSVWVLNWQMQFLSHYDRATEFSKYLFLRMTLGQWITLKLHKSSQWRDHLK